MTTPVRQGRATPGPAALCVHSQPPHTLEAGVAHITDILAPRFTGHVGPVRFVRGHAETNDPQMVDYFTADPDRYAVTETDEPATPYTDATERQVDALERGMPHDQVAKITEDDDPQE